MKSITFLGKYYAFAEMGLHVVFGFLPREETPDIGMGGDGLGLSFMPGGVDPHNRRRGRSSRAGLARSVRESASGVVERTL